MKNAIEYAIKVGLTCAIAATLMLPSSTALGSDRGGQQSTLAPLPLPPIEHLETIPWFALQPSPQALKIDTLLGPKYELFGPAVANDDRSSGAWAGGESQTQTMRNG
jgi:hypothetical protein